MKYCCIHIYHINNKLNINNNPKNVAVSKTFKIDKILPLIEHGHVDFGENKVQEAIEKWTEIKKKNSKIKTIVNPRIININPFVNFMFKKYPSGMYKFERNVLLEKLSFQNLIQTMFLEGCISLKV